MTFHEVTRMMLSSMDFFELRRTAARYSVQFQGVRRQKLIRDIERKIIAKASPMASEIDTAAETTLAAQSPMGAVSARPALTSQVESRSKKVGGINTFSARGSFTAR